jgi:menaquinone-9 beta-reductase
VTTVDLKADVCVVGAGPAGSATAWLLARAGADVLVLDRARFPRDKPCAEYLSPEASRMLAAMGVLGEIEQHSRRLSGMKVRSPDGSWLHGTFSGARPFRGFRDQGLAVRRTVLDNILVEAAVEAGARVVQGVRVQQLLSSNATVTGVAASGPEGELRVQSKFVIGADGLRSVVAKRLGVARRLRWPRRMAFVAHYEGISEISDAGEMHVGCDGYVGIAPVGDVVNVALVVPTRTTSAMAGDPASFLDAWIARQDHLRTRFAGARRIDTVRATGPFASRVTHAWRPGAALVGDAADFYDPFTGEGIYAALRGAELLAPLVLEALKERQAEASVLGAYDPARRSEFGPKWNVERLVSAAVASPLVMNHVTAALGRRRDLADLLVGVCGDFVPPRELLRWRFVLPLLAGARTPAVA